MMKTIKRLICLLASVLVLWLGVSPVLADENTYSYSTKGGSWIPVELTTSDGKSVWKQTDKSDSYALDKNKDGTFETDPVSGMPLILLQMNGSEWTFSFVTESSGNYEYNVIETMKDGQAAEYTVVDKDGNPVSYITVKGGTGILVNKKDIKSGNLEIKKLVEGDASSSARFRFDIQLRGDGFGKYLKGTKTFGPVTFVDGKASVYLSNGESVTVVGLPAGIGYTVTEVPVTGFNTSWEMSDMNGTKSGSSMDVSNLIEVSDTDKVTFTNSVPTDKPEPDYGQLAVSKTVVNGNKDVAFKFTAVFSGLKPDTSYSYQYGSVSSSFRSDSGGIVQVQFELKDGESAKFVNLPVGCFYQIVESGAADYTASFEIHGENVKAAQAQKDNEQANEDLSTSKETLDKGEEATVAFTNKGPEPGPEKKLTEITVQKKWDDGGDRYGVRPENLSIYLLQSTDKDDVKQGDVVDSVILTVEDQAASDTSTWSWTFKDLPAEDENGNPYYYYATENKDGLDEHYKDSTVVNEDDKTITITNKYTVLVNFPEAGQAGITMLIACGLGAMVYGAVQITANNTKNKKKGY